LTWPYHLSLLLYDVYDVRLLFYSGYFFYMLIFYSFYSYLRKLIVIFLHDLPEFEKFGVKKKIKICRENQNSHFMPNTVFPELFPSVK
jgi:hypothetical protein